MGLRSGGYAAVRGPFRREVAPDRLIILGGVRAAGRSIQALNRLQDHLARAADRVDRARAPVGPRAEVLRRRDGRPARGPPAAAAAARPPSAARPIGPPAAAAMRTPGARPWLGLGPCRWSGRLSK